MEIAKDILTLERNADKAVLRLSGRLDAAGVTRAWKPALEAVAQGGAVTIDASGLEYLDGAGAALIIQMKLESRQAGTKLDIAGLDERFARLVDSVDLDSVQDPGLGGRERNDIVTQVGRLSCLWCDDLKELVSYVGECAMLAVWAMRHPRKIRWRDVRLSALHVGVNSLPILLLIGFLIGMIMSFQSAVSLQRFAAEIFVPNMLGLVMFREMGALTTAILLAARSGSAFAAEIGTMKVNEELDALVTMGLSPMRFLVLPKVLATLMMVPVMVMFFNFAALLGGVVVMLSLGFPLATFTTRVFMNTNFTDFAGGMVKVMVFSLLVAGIGCLRGMQTQSGAGAVGISTTRAVVSGLVLIAVADGIFAVAFFFLKI